MTQVALEACEFWLVIAEDPDAAKVLANYMPELIPLLLSRMRYTELDLIVMPDAVDDAHVPDRPEDIKPRFHHPRRSHRTVRLGGHAYARPHPWC